MKTLRFLVGLLAVSLLMGCSEELPKPMRRERTTVCFRSDWSALASDFTRPEQYRLRIDEADYPASGDMTEISLYAHKNYTVVAYTLCDWVTVEGTTAAFAQTRAGNNPLSIGEFAATVVDLADLSGERRDVPVAMQQRSFRFQIDLTTGSSDITMVNATLSGVAESVDLRTGEVLTSVTSPITFRVEHGDAGDHLIASAGVLGVCGRQVLDLDIYTMESNYRVRCDLTDALATLTSREDNKELLLSAELVLTGMTGTVTDWEVTTGEPIEFGE